MNIIPIEKYRRLIEKLKTKVYPILLSQHFECIYTSWHFYATLKKIFNSEYIGKMHLEDNVMFESSFNKMFIWLYVDYRNWLQSKIKKDHQLPITFIRVTIILSILHNGEKSSNSETKELKEPLNLWETKKFYKYINWLTKRREKFLEGINC